MQGFDTITVIGIVKSNIEVLEVTRESNEDFYFLYLIREKIVFSSIHIQFSHELNTKKNRKLQYFPVESEDGK